MNKNYLKKAQVVAEKMIETAKSGIDKAGDYLESKAEPIKTKIAVSCKKAELESLFAEYGKAMYYNENTENITAIIEKIEELEDIIVDLEKTCTEEESDNKYCTKCGAEFSADDSFCSKCGAELKK